MTNPLVPPSRYHGTRVQTHVPFGENLNIALDGVSKGFELVCFHDLLQF